MGEPPYRVIAFAFTHSPTSAFRQKNPFKTKPSTSSSSCSNSLSLSMESLSSSLYLNQALTPRHPCPVKWRSSGSVLLLGFSSPRLKTPPFLRKGIIKASVAVEQQTQKTKTAVIRIGTRGRYFSLFPPLHLLQLS